MCLSVPSQITAVHDDTSVTVDTLGVKRRVSSHLMTEPLKVGEFVLIHIGFVMNKIDTEDAKLSLELYKEIVDKLNDEGNDL
ncbi:MULTISPECIES: HypC/HybG/HupF family hydrogenase formation chaperone [unclassified Shewanella]|uniref:HypC/HybG/HupF family hydrogenase formation chaperone n=1 Tax=unclassified Shewanella TaxID=196818 RepID=UPI000C84FD23|nr:MULTISPECIES: HypC/HybG/HupF family hydrogenase formation chaperone [unclassified Shewanella]MDO6618345.1 HypC/HybG/HupF family hydrogenase formation chaperone [Shewanella sp. 6_MG-2023]MDO6640710.1 HypC/HybG/HupF family hydrogenase formation chaperone [Shewanella sp. 5_MG-2023]MDO6679250.1 HypC/HybG/HupF family hydrogenase formation chaperone [Shewanella sp. 4_MG-2023]MDO6776414.1 HypC/HybG/HupF family hydrogenase formation chaperone [Shewanella sp. 3_MG-2023]PMG28390.1 hydrogenase assembl